MPCYVFVFRARKNELDKIGGLAGKLVLGGGVPPELSEFYDRLKTIKDYYRRHPQDATKSVTQSLELEYKKRNRELDFALTEKLFSGEEAFGRYLDLQHCFELYINLPTVRKIDFVSYIGILEDAETAFDGLEKGVKARESSYKRCAVHDI